MDPETSVAPVTPTEQLSVAQPAMVTLPPPEPEKPKFKKKLLLIIGVVVVLVILGAVGIFALTQMQKPEQVAEEPTLTPGALEEDEMAGWKTFEDGTILVQYPSDLDDSTQEQGTALVLFKIGPTQREGTEFYDGISLRFRVVEISGATPLELAEQNIAQDEPVGVEVVKDPEPISINGHEGVTYTVRGLGEHSYIILRGPGAMFVEIINSSVDPGNLGYENTVDQILSTFEFTN